MRQSFYLRFLKTEKGDYSASRAQVAEKSAELPNRMAQSANDATQAA